ncbi:amidohydrolase family protein [Paenibacillus antibioticophila]|uniref:hypothetical protein n=1 Tax=Paenibacillus antibioticophila TaxID=1274374 RepID=UPI0005CB390C|nr:hypothetical protein [Paenibacillus antibioticophila]
MKDAFIQALTLDSLAELQHIPKSDLHNHAGRGGSMSYIGQWAGTAIHPPIQPFEDLSEMQQWFEENIKVHCQGLQGYLKRIEASFAQAHQDQVTVLSMSFGMGEVDSLGSMEHFMTTINELHQLFAPRTKFYPELALDRADRPEAILNRVEELFSYGWFTSIDICNNELAQPITAFKPVYRCAQSYGVKLRAHVGEFGSADDVMEAVEELELQEVHHGIAAAASPQIMKWLANHLITLHICPTSNVMLKVADSYDKHPIRTLFDHGVPVTINTDDLLIFNQSVSEEYLNLFRSGLMTPEELNLIREYGLNDYNSSRKSSVDPSF